MKTYKLKKSLTVEVKGELPKKYKPRRKPVKDQFREDFIQGVE
jgi:hypothetical protein